MSKKRNFAIGEYYHVYIRTVLRVPEFKDRRIASRLKFIFRIANSTVSGEVFTYIRTNEYWSMRHVLDILNEGEKLTNVLTYTVMPNHYHLLLQEIEEGGIQTFMHTTNTAIAMYVNTAQDDRDGSLFNGPYDAKHVENNTYLLHLSRYHHLNPLDVLVGKKWRKGKLRNWDKVRDDLVSYPWASTTFYVEGEKDPILSGTDVITEQFKNGKEYEKFLRDWSDDSFDFIKEFIE